MKQLCSLPDPTARAYFELEKFIAAATFTYPAYKHLRATSTICSLSSARLMGGRHSTVYCVHYCCANSTEKNLPPGTSGTRKSKQ